MSFSGILASDYIFCEYEAISQFLQFEADPKKEDPGKWVWADAGRNGSFTWASGLFPTVLTLALRPGRV